MHVAASLYVDYIFQCSYLILMIVLSTWWIANQVTTSCTPVYRYHDNGYHHDRVNIMTLKVRHDSGSVERQEAG